MEITFKTNSSSVVGSGKHDFKKRMESKQLISKVISEFISEYVIKSLQEVIVYDFEKCPTEYGSVDRFYVDGTPKTILNISDIIAGQLHFPQFYNFAYHTIHHEMCHIQDYETICRHMDGNLLSSDYECKYCLDSLYFISGYQFFGEYISYRNCYISYAEQFPNNDFIPKIKQLSTIINRLCETYDKNSRLRKYMFDKTIEDVKPIIYFVCQKLGYHHASKDRIFLENLDLVNESPFLKYITRVGKDLDILYSTYPSWISYEKYVEIGKMLFSVFNEYGITLFECEEDICFDIQKQ